MEKSIRKTGEREGKEVRYDTEEWVGRYNVNEGVTYK